jgi:hypothetical protein
MIFTCVKVSGWHRFVKVPLACGALLFAILLAGMSWPALAASPITGVTISPASKSIHSGQAVYLRATVQGTGDFDRRVNWSLSPNNAGNLSPTGLFISDPNFTGNAAVKATSVEAPTFSGSATITMAAGAGVVHVDLNNGGDQDGSALHPYRTIQAAIDSAADGYTIKVAQGTYSENVVLAHAVLLLGGFAGGSAQNYADGKPGNFVTRSTDHVSQVTTIQAPDRTNPVVFMANYGPLNPVTYAVDGFTLTGGFSGLDLRGETGQVDCFVSQNLITNNGPVTPASYDRGGGIRAENVNILVLNNRITNNVIDWGGGCFISTDVNTFLVQGNIIENNIASGGLGGGGGEFGGTAGIFTWNIVRNNQAGNLVDYGHAGGIIIGSSPGIPAELSHNVYAGNKAMEAGGVYLEGGAAIFRHELIYLNTINSSYSGGAVFLYPNTVATLEHCTITGNINAVEGATGGLYVRETATAQVSNSIIWGNSGNQLYVDPSAIFTMTYSDSQAYPGTGDISVDPLFADAAGNDYHLKSMKGRWNPTTSAWVWDPVHSPCIDAGDPAAPFDQEPIPNGARTNMGVYGNTPEASKSRQDTMGGVLDLLTVD